MLLVFLLALAGAIGLFTVRDSWGRRWLLAPRVCRPPDLATRLGAWGRADTNHPIPTAFLEAQLLFGQGLLLSWDFNQVEAAASFRACLAVDPQAAMCEWGVAHAVGPYLNVVAGTGEERYPTFGPAQFREAHGAARRALQLAEQALEDRGNTSSTWRQLSYCRAAAIRFADGSHLPPARETAERQYAQQMAAIGEASQDATALALAAEGLMQASRLWGAWSRGCLARQLEAAVACFFCFHTSALSHTIFCLPCTSLRCSNLLPPLAALALGFLGPRRAPAPRGSRGRGAAALGAGAGAAAPAGPPPPRPSG